MNLVVMIPALNEQATIGDVIGRIPREIAGIDSVSALVVDDGSTDSTAACARDAGAAVIGHGRNRGLGVAFATGIDASLKMGADIIVNIDADGQFRPEDIPQLVRPILNGEADLATCSRFARRDLIPEMPVVKLWGNWLVAQIVDLATGLKLSDVSCGFRAYSREAALRLNLYGRFTYTQEVLIDLAAKGMRIAEVPLEVRGVREFGQSRVASSVLAYGIRALHIMVTAMRDVNPLRFFGAIGSGTFVLGALLGVFVIVHWLLTGRTSPYTSVLIGSAVGILLGFLLLVLAMMADMIGRVRGMMEQLLLSDKSARYGERASSPSLSAERPSGVDRPR